MTIFHFDNPLDVFKEDSIVVFYCRHCLKFKVHNQIPPCDARREQVGALYNAVPYQQSIPRFLSPVRHVPCCVIVNTLGTFFEPQAGGFQGAPLV